MIALSLTGNVVLGLFCCYLLNACLVAERKVSVAQQALLKLLAVGMSGSYIPRSLMTHVMDMVVKADILTMTTKTTPMTEEEIDEMDEDDYETTSVKLSIER